MCTLFISFRCRARYSKIKIESCNSNNFGTNVYNLKIMFSRFIIGLVYSYAWVKWLSTQGMTPLGNPLGLLIYAHMYLALTLFKKMLHAVVFRDNVHINTWDKTLFHILTIIPIINLLYCNIQVE